MRAEVRRIHGSVALRGRGSMPLHSSRLSPEMRVAKGFNLGLTILLPARAHELDHFVVGNCLEHFSSLAGLLQHTKGNFRWSMPMWRLREGTRPPSR